MRARRGRSSTRSTALAGAPSASPRSGSRRAISFTFVAPSSSSSRPTLRVYPSVERLRRLAGPRATRPVTGSRPAAVAGEGIEFAELRFLAPGERARRINWRATAARGRLLVNDRLPERSSDVVIFLDALGAAATSAASTLDHAVRAAASLSEAYLRRRDRVGLSASAATSSGSSPARACASSIGSRTPCSRARSRERTAAGATRASSRAGSSAPVADRRADAAARLARHARSSISAAAATRSRSSRSIRSRTSPTPRPPPGRSPGEPGCSSGTPSERLAGAGIALASWGPDEPIAAPVEALAAAR